MLFREALSVFVQHSFLPTVSRFERNVFFPSSTASVFCEALIFTTQNMAGSGIGPLLDYHFSLSVGEKRRKHFYKTLTTLTAFSRVQQRLYKIVKCGC